MKFRKTCTVFSIALLVLSGCSESREGNPRPVPSVESSGSVESPAPGTDVGVFGDTKACDLLNQALQGQGYNAGEVSNSGSLNGCQASKSGIAVRLDLDDQQGVDELRGDPSQMYEGDVNGRRAKQLKRPSSPGAGCYVAMEVGAKARAMVLAGFGTNPSVDEACVEAEKLAAAVEPQLPRV
ncbi:DUF3558 family protein [Amycolatopsis magusensis]|uniref:DUF3558 family protein n=1 Tax=Amycolatopsis magusensis TaxID=882444 RepID=UPI0037AAE0C0